MNTFDIRIPYIEVRDTGRNIIGIIEGAEIFFEYAFQDCGEFEIYCRATENNLKLLQKDNYITLPVNADTTAYLIEKNSNMWVIEKIQRANNRTGGRWITATGREAKQITDRRIINTTQVLKNGAVLVDEIKTKLFDNNLTIADERDPRKISGFVFAPSEVVDTVKNETQVTYDGLFKFTEELYLTYGIGAKLRLNRDTKEMLYTIYKGSDRTNVLVFSRGNENLISTDYVEDWTEYKNYALVGGEEKDNIETDPVTGITIRNYTTRTFLIIGNDNADIHRREVFVDAKDLQSDYQEQVNGQTVDRTYTKVQYLQMLSARGHEKLTTENNLKIEFTGEIDVTNDRYRFNIDYYLGDKVLIRDDDFGISVPVIISKFIKVQNDEGYKEYFEYKQYEEV